MKPCQSCHCSLMTAGRCTLCGVRLCASCARNYTDLCRLCFDAEYADRDLIETPADPQGVTLEAREETEPC